MTATPGLRVIPWGIGAVGTEIVTTISTTVPT